MKFLLTFFSICALIVLLVISYALMKDIIDNTTGKKVPDREGKILGIAGFIICGVLTYIIYRFLFPS